MTRKLLMSFLTVTFVAMLWPQSSNAGYIEEKDGKTIIHVKVFGLPDPSNSSTINRADVEAVKAFRKAFPAIFKKKYRAKYKANPEKYGKHNWDNVEIQLDKFSGIKVEKVENDLLAIAGGMAPDILYINFRKSDNYIRNGFLYPLDEYYKTLTKEQIDWRINKKIIPVCRRRGPDGKEHWWTMPFGGVLGKVLVYRKDLFDEKNIPYPDEKWTWKDLYAACKKITNPGKGIYGIRLGRGVHESWYWITFLWSAGGDIMLYNKDTDEWRCTWDTNAAVLATDFYTRLSAEPWYDKEGKIRRGYAYKDAAEASQKWERGEIGMMFNYIEQNLLARIDPATTGMAPIPLGPDGKTRGGELNSRMFGIFSEVELDAVRDAAWEYLLYWDCINAQKIRTKIMVEGGYGKFVNPKYLKMFGYQEILKLQPKGWKECFDIAIATGQPEPYGKNSNFAYTMMTTPLQKAEELELLDKLPPPPETKDGGYEPIKESSERFKILKGLLVKSCDRATEIMIGKISPREMLKRRIVACIALLAIAVTFFMVFRKIFKIFTPPADTGQERAKKWDLKKYYWSYMLLIPACLTIFVWRYIPLARGSYMGFFDYQILRSSTFVWVDNFANLLFDSMWWQSVWNALRYSFLVMALTFLPPIILAILLQEVPRGKIIFRTIYYLPAVITGLVTMLLWKQFYEPSENGTLNKIILNIPAFGFILIALLLLLLCLAFANRFRFYEMWLPMVLFIIAGGILFITVAGMAGPILFPNSETFAEALPLLPGRLLKFTPEPYRWLADSNTAMISCVMPMVWAGMGPGCLIYLAALKGIPEDYYEAADLDGATFIDKILFVVFPTLKALVIINFVGVFIGSWMRSTGMILVMTGGGANTETAGLHIWYEAFTYLRFGPATAMAWTLGFMLIGFTVHQLQILSKVEFRAAGQKK